LSNRGAHSDKKFDLLDILSWWLLWASGLSNAKLNVTKLHGLGYAIRDEALSLQYTAYDLIRFGDEESAESLIEPLQVGSREVDVIADIILGGSESVPNDQAS
jgi:hypothetical protein